MPSCQDPAFPEASKLLSNHRLIRAALRDHYGQKTNPILRRLRLGEPLPADCEEAYDILIDTLHNQAPVLRSFEAEQDKGVYEIVIRGLAGAYFVQASEYPDSEIFLSRKDAEAWIQTQFGEFLL